MATTSFIDEALALYQELQKHIDVASTVASETQTDWGLLQRIAGHLAVTRQRTSTNSTKPNLTLPARPNTEPTPKVILEAVLRIERQLNTGLVHSPNEDRTYTTAAHQGAGTPQATPQRTITLQPTPPLREFKTIMVQVKDLAQAVGLQRVACKKLLERIQMAGGHTQQIVEICRMMSGDLLIRTQTEVAQQGLDEDTTWLEWIAPTATIKRKIYTVAVHSIWVAGVDMTTQNWAIKALLQQNRGLHPGLTIEHLTWPKSAEGKCYSTLHINTYSVTVANRLIDEGLLEDLKVHTCEVFNRATQLTQCFHCQAYSHIARACRNITKCAFCTGEHWSGECRRTEDSTKAKCANCHQTGHAAWMRVCPIQDKEIEHLQVVCMSTPARFLEGHKRRQSHSSPLPPAHQEPTPTANLQPTTRSAPTPASPPPPPPPLPRQVQKWPWEGGDFSTIPSSPRSSNNSSDEGHPITTSMVATRQPSSTLVVGSQTTLKRSSGRPRKFSK